MAVLKFRHKFFSAIHKWFGKKEFIEVYCPIITEALLYDESTAFFLITSVGVFTKVYL